MSRPRRGDAPPPVLVVVTGHPATGKTTLARRLARELGYALVAKDAIKERLFDTLGAGDLEWSHHLGHASMKVLYDQLDAILSVGYSAVAEANFDADLAGRELRSLLTRTKSRVVQVVMHAAGDAIVERFEERVESGERHPGHPDEDAIDELARRVAKPYVPPELPGPKITVDGTRLERLDEDKVVEQVREAIATLN